MTTTFPGQLYPTKEDLEETYRGIVASESSRNGLEVNTLEGSEYAFKATACATITTVGFANNKLGLQGYSPLTAQGDQLIEGARSFGVTERPAIESTGRINAVMSQAGTQTIPDGWEGTCADGTRFKVVGAHNLIGTVVAGVVTVTGATPADYPVLVRTKTAGANTEQAVGTQITWDSPALGLIKRNAKVAAGGLTGGRDADSLEVLRARWIERMQAPSSDENWSEVKTTAENSSAAIQRAYVYCCAQGPGSTAIALVSDSADRSVSESIIKSALAAVSAKSAGRVKWNVTTVVAEEVDVVVAIKLPLPVSAGGPGGGWVDSAPWPDAASGAVKIDAYNTATGQVKTTATTLTLAGGGTLVAGMHVSVWSHEDQQLLKFTLSEALVSGGFVRLKAVGGFPTSVLNCYVSPSAIGIDGYVETLLTSLRSTGPGEKTTSHFVLPRARRKPSEDVVGRKGLESWVTKELQQAHSEITDANYAARYATGTTTLKTGPSVPAASSDPPYILVPKYVAFSAAS